MIFALALIFAATICGASLTYLYERDAPLLVRLAIGCVTGFAAQGLLCFALALHFGLNAPVIAIATLPLLSPLLLFRFPKTRRQILSDIRRQMRMRGRSRYRFPHLLLSIALIGVLLWVYRGVAYMEDGGLFTSNHHNYGDLPWHIALAQGFTVGGNYPPEHLQFAGSRLTYPYLNDFVTAELTVCGATLIQAFLLTNLCLALSLLALWQHFAFRLTRSPFVMVTAPFLLFFSGGWGFLMLIGDLQHNTRPLLDFFMHLPHDYTIFEKQYRWGNSITALFTTQRSILLGMPIALAALMQLHTALKQQEHKSRGISLFAAGAIAGLLPLSHTHTALVVLSVAVCYALPELWRDRKNGIKSFAAWESVRDWAAFFVPAVLLMAPQGLMLLSGTEAHTTHYFGWEPGWDSSGENGATFWLRNAGLFLPLLLLSFFWRGKRPLVSPLLKMFFLPFVLWLILPNLFKFAPWIWDNIKVLIYGYLAAIPLVLLPLARLWKKRFIGKLCTLILLVMLTLSGMLDVFRIATGQYKQRIYGPEEIAFAEAVNITVPAPCRILSAPVHNHAITLAGRRLLCGYPGHLWSHGFDFQGRANDMKRIYNGDAQADALLNYYQIQYIALGPPERNEKDFPLNEAYLARFPAVVTVGPYRLLHVPNYLLHPPVVVIKPQ